MEERNSRSHITRRQLLTWGAVAGMGTLLAACQPKVVEKVVKETVVVEKEKPVEVTKIVEKEKEVTKVVQQLVTPTPAPPRKIKMTFFVAWGGDYGKRNAEVAQMWMQKNPNVEIETSIGQDLQQTVVAIAGGTPPDVSHQFWLWLRSLITQGVLLDLSEQVANAKGSKRENFSKGYWDMCDAKGKTYAIPYFQAGVRHAMFWNKTLLEKAGLDPEKPPKTPDELLMVGEKLTKFDSKGQIEILGYAITDYQPLHYWGRALGVEWYDPVRRQVRYNQPAFLEFLNKRLAYIQKIGWDKIAAWSDALTQAKQNPFVYEKTAITTSHGDWFVSNIRSGNPKLEGRYGVTYVPSPIGKRTILGYTHTMCIPKGSKEKEAAWAFVDWACGSEEVCEKAYKETGSVAPWLPWRSKQKWDAPDKLPFTAWFLNTLQEADYSGPEDYPDLIGMIGVEAQTRIQSAEQAIWTGQLKPAEALQRLDAEIQPLVDQAIKQYNL